MADKTINQLTAATGITDSSLFVIEQNSTAKSINWGLMKNYISPVVTAQYSSSKTYSIGDYVVYNSALKRCVVQITTPESYTAAHWEDAVLTDDVAYLGESDMLINSLAAKGEYTFSSNDFESGWWAYTSKGVDSKQLRTRRLIPVRAGEYVTYTNPTMRLRIGVCSTRKASAYAQSTGWIAANGAGTIPITTDGYMVIVLQNATDITTANYDSTIKLFSPFYKYFGANAWSINTADTLGAVKENAGDLVRAYSNSSGYGAEYTISNTSLADEILSLKRTLPDGVNILPILSNKDTKTNNGITYSWVDDTTIHMNGTASAESFYNLIISRQQMIPGISPGDDVLVKIDNMAVHASVMVYYYTGGTTTVHVLEYTAFTRLIRIPDDATGLMFRIIVPSGTAISNVDTKIELIVKPQIKHVRALFIGNSYTNDCVNYAPFIAEGLSHGVAFTIGTTYYSGASIDNYVTWFDNDTATLTYYKKHGLFPKWNTGVANQTLKQCIADEPWDIIVFQQASYNQGTWSTFSNLNTLINKVLTYNASVHTKAVKVGWMFPQLRYSIIGSTTYAKVVECVQNVLNTTPIDFFIPCGTAVQNARGTSLDSIGDSGHLCADGDGHLQAGLPSLLASYVSALKLLELAGEHWHGILQDATRPTATWVTNINSPGENGTSTGVTDANCYLAQKCAVAAMKFPTTVSTVV